MLVGCGKSEAAESKEFESLLVLVEEGEAVLETGMTKWKGVLNDFVNCLSEMEGLSFLCEDHRADLESVLKSTSDKYQLQELRARLQSLRLTDNEEASQARDAYVKHLRAWYEYVLAFQTATPTASELSKNDLSFATKWSEISMDEIVATFDETCSALGNGQPTNAEEFASRIIDVCDD